MGGDGTPPEGHRHERTRETAGRKCIDGLRRGELTEADLQRILELAGKPQDLLYLQAEASSLASNLLGMRIVENGEMWDGPEDPEDWPYKTVLDAVRDGWRVIKFPELALMLDDRRSYGLGCDFIR